MSKKIIFSGQSLFNKVVECTGDVDNAFEMMLLNNIFNLTQDPIVGEELKISKITNNGVINYFNENNRPATAISKNKSKKQDYVFPYEFAINF